jgi:hypothetical protein
LLFIIVGCTKKEETANNQTQEQQKEQIVFDVPALLEKNIDEIRQVLGNPTDGNFIDPTEDQLKLSGDKDMEWSNTFKKDGRELLVSYGSRSRKVIDFFISSDDLDQNKDKEQVMNWGNVQNDDSRYSLEFVNALKDPNLFTGIKITPKL